MLSIFLVFCKTSRINPLVHAQKFFDVLKNSSLLQLSNPRGNSIIGVRQPRLSKIVLFRIRISCVSIIFFDNFTLQSAHSGIEIQQVTNKVAGLQSYNQPIVELKCRTILALLTSSSSYNQPIVELKFKSGLMIA